MSTTVVPVLVDLQQLRAAFGSGNERLFEVVADLAAEQWTFDDEDRAGPEEVRQAIRHFIMGESLNQFQPTRYAFAFESICNHLGDTIEPDTWGGVRWEALQWVGLAELLIKGPPIALPPDEFGPRIGFLTAAEVRTKVEELSNNPPTSNDENDAELLEEYAGWLNEAASRGKSIVFFT